MNTLSRVEPPTDEELAAFEAVGIPEALADQFPAPVQVVSVRVGYREDGSEGMLIALQVGSNGNSAHEELWIHDPDGHNPYGLNHRQVSLLGLAAEARRRIDRRRCDESSTYIG